MLILIYAFIRDVIHCIRMRQISAVVETKRSKGIMAAFLCKRISIFHVFNTKHAFYLKQLKFPYQ